MVYVLKQKNECKLNHPKRGVTLFRDGYNQLASLLKIWVHLPTFQFRWNLIFGSFQRNIMCKQKKLGVSTWVFVQVIHLILSDPIFLLILLVHVMYIERYSKISNFQLYLLSLSRDPNIDHEPNCRFKTVFIDWMTLSSKDKKRSSLSRHWRKSFVLLEVHCFNYYKSFVLYPVSS